MPNVVIETENDKIILRFPEFLTIHSVQEVKNELVNVTDNFTDVFLDLSDITEIDSAGFQLLYALIREIRKKGICEIAASESVKNMFSTYNVEL
jgi:anti-anti-sigma factor